MNARVFMPVDKADFYRYIAREPEGRGPFTSPQLGVAAQVSIHSIEQKSGISFGTLIAVDPLSDGNESVGAVVSAPLLALEQIRFLSQDAESRTRKKRR